MDISTREIGDTLLVDMVGPFPRDRIARLDDGDRFRRLVANREHLILVLKDLGTPSTEDLGAFMMWLKHAGLIGMANEPTFRLVFEDDRVADIFRIGHGALLVYSNEKEALSVKWS